MSRPILYLSGPYSATPDRTVAENIEEYLGDWGRFCARHEQMEVRA